MGIEDELNKATATAPVPPVVVPPVNPPFPVPVLMNFDSAVALAKDGLTVRRSGAFFITLRHTDITATDWVKD